jgi:phosphopantothenoylcysteine decarboxylase / phosphopantothenate---cysteine ligase
MNNRHITGIRRRKQKNKMFHDKKILLGVSGSIAAYKSAYLARLLIKEGALVKVVMTKSAINFVAPLTFSTISNHAVYTDFVSEGNWVNHVDYGLWADFMLIAPATANTIAKLANGICDNLLSGIYLSAKCPVFIAPAMDLDMYNHPATKKNLEILQSYGNEIIPVGKGHLASGLEGEGRMAEPDQILEYLKKKDSESAGIPSPLTGKRIVVNAGATREPIDPVRFITNHSTGKMGITLAEELEKAGGDVTLILGHSQLMPKSNQIKVIHVSTADEMYQASMQSIQHTDIFIGAAAVADFTPVFKGKSKLKKKDIGLSLNLMATQDILKSLGEHKKKNQLLIGFAMETDNPIDNAKGKILSKNLDFIVLNNLNDKGAGFGTETNKITIIDRSNKITNFELKPKQETAKDIVEYLIKYMHA